MAYTSEIDKLERRLRENPEGRTFAPLADAYRKAGDVPRALEILKTGLQLHPDYLSASIVLGRCHLDLGDLASAEGAFRRVLELDKENVIAIKALADITERQARFDESEHWLSYLLSIDGSNEEARLQLQRLDGARDQHSRLSAPLEESAAASETVKTGELDTVEISPVSSAQQEPEIQPESEPEPEPEPEPESEPEPEPIADEAEVPSAAPTAFLEIDEPSSDDQELIIVRDERTEKTTTEFVLDEDPLEGPTAAVAQFDVGVERHEEIVLRPSSTSEFQVPSDAELLRGEGASGGFVPSFEEDAPPPARMEEAAQPAEGLTAEDLWQAHPEDATVAEIPGREEPPVPTPEPDPEPAVSAPAAMDLGQPMVTETIGDVYAAQGHFAQALEVYRQLLQRSPNDLRLTEKIEELESRKPAAMPPAARGFAAAETGGQSVRSYFGDLLSARLPDSNGSPSAPPAEGEPAEPASTGYMEEAFQADEETPVSGEPTRPASGPLSLSAIFGEDSSPVPPVVAGLETKDSKPQTSHFDEFFGERPAPQGTTRTRSVRLDSDQDDLEQFHKWLKGLKR
jgi:tetratricopeptide (TPR) repeat protein